MKLLRGEEGRKDKPLSSVKSWIVGDPSQCFIGLSGTWNGNQEWVRICFGDEERVLANEVTEGSERGSLKGT